MVGFSHSVAEFVWALAIALAAVAVTLAGFLFLRRAFHAAVSRHSQKLSARLEPWIEGLLDGSLDYETGLDTLREYPKYARRAVRERLTLAFADAGPECLARLSRLCTDLGLVDLWRRQLSRQPSGGLLSGLMGRGLTPLERLPGLSFVARAEAAENLGLIRDRRNSPLLVKASNDPNPAVRSVAVRALGRIHAPATFPILASRLQDAALGQGRNVSVRSLKMTLASFPLIYAADLGAMLQHPHRRVRFLAADVIAAMVQHSSLRAQSCYIPRDPLLDPIAEIFLNGLVIDENPDVRARAADVIGHLDDGRAVPALLTLLEDREWFVRLHATRALAECASFPIDTLGSRLVDSNWRVREAAAQALTAQGQRGVRFLLTHFRATSDRYSREQVAEQIERLGLIPSLVAAFGDLGATEETQFIEGMVRLGRTASLRAGLQSAPEYKRSGLLAELRQRGESSGEELFPSTGAGSATPLSIARSRGPRSGP